MTQPEIQMLQRDLIILWLQLLQQQKLVRHTTQFVSMYIQLNCHYIEDNSITNFPTLGRMSMVRGTLYEESVRRPASPFVIMVEFDYYFFFIYLQKKRIYFEFLHSVFKWYVRPVKKHSV